MRRWALFGVVVAAAVAAAPARGQQASPHIGYVYPAGGKQGTTFQVTVAGQYLNGVSAARVSGEGVAVKLVTHDKPLTGKEATELREKLQALQKQRRDPALVRQILEIRTKLAEFAQKRAIPALGDTAILQITLSPDAAPGDRDLRLATAVGLSNPLVFRVGRLNEFIETPPPPLTGPGSFRAFRNRYAPGADAETPPTDVTLPGVLNGQILPGGVDRFRFTARKGQKLVFAAAAQQLIPYIADAVPGWFQAVLALYDPNGNEVAYADDFRFHPDPVLYHQVRRDGQYVLAIWDALYRGRQDFVYRITAGELPFVTNIFPLGGRAGTRTTVEADGWNLPAGRFVQDAAGKAPGVYPFFVREAELQSNLLPFAVDDLPECMEAEPNGPPRDAQPIKLPIIVNGRIDPPGDADVFGFEGRAGQVVVAEVMARRLDSPLDSTLCLTDAAGRELAFNDDHEDKGCGLVTHHADSYLRAILPADGTYRVRLGDAQGHGGREYAYRLRIGPPRGDFALRIAPSSVNVRGAASVPLTVCAVRKDGFAGPIDLSLVNAPPGFSLAGARVPAGQDEVRVTLTASPTATTQPVCLSVEGRANVQGRQVVRPAVPAEDMMQAFAYRHLVCMQELDAAVTRRGRGRPPIRVLSAMPVKIPAGKTAQIRVGVPARTLVGELRLELSDPPEGIAIRGATPTPRDTEIVLASDAAKVRPGQKGNLIVEVRMLVKPRPMPGKAAPQPRLVSVGTLPAIPFEIVPP